LGIAPIGAAVAPPYVARRDPRSTLWRRPMPDQTTTTPSDRAPLVTLVAVVVLAYVAIVAVVVGQAF